MIKKWFYLEAGNNFQSSVHYEFYAGQVQLQLEQPKDLNIVDVEFLNEFIKNLNIPNKLISGTFEFGKQWTRFSLDNMNQNLFEIDNKLSSGAITEEDAEQQKEKVRQDIDFFSCLDGSSRFLEGNMKAMIFIYMISIAGGCLVGVLQNTY